MRTLIALTFLGALPLVSTAATIVVDLDHTSNRPSIMLVEDGGAISATYPIAAPKHTPSCLLKGPVTGIVHTIDHRATWTPTARTRAAKAAKGIVLKAQYGPGDRGNALGGRKIIIDWDDPCILSTVRIHGTNAPSVVRAQARASRGCIRMLNDDWNKLARAIAAGTPVILTRAYTP